MHQTREKHHDVLESRQNVHEMLQAEKKFFFRGEEKIQGITLTPGMTIPFLTFTYIL